MLSRDTVHVNTVREEAIRRARKKARDIRGFYFSALLYALIIPIFWIVNLSVGGPVWAHWPMPWYPRAFAVRWPHCIWRRLGRAKS
jgi:ABC-type spermidine/putrescine transport system permease subunit II